MVDAVHAKRVAAINAWDTSENTNWSAYVDTVADARETLASESVDAHTASFTSTDDAAETRATSWNAAQATAAKDSATAVETFTTDSTAAHSAFEQSAKTATLTLTSGHNTKRSAFLGSLATQRSDAEAASGTALTQYNTDLAAAQGTLSTSIAGRADTLATDLAAAGRTFAEESAGSQQTFREAVASAEQTRNNTVAQADKEASAAEVACPPKSSPVRMRVSTGLEGQGDSYEAQATQFGADCSEVARGGSAQVRGEGRGPDLSAA